MYLILQLEKHGSFGELQNKSQTKDETHFDLNDKKRGKKAFDKSEFLCM